MGAPDLLQYLRGAGLLMRVTPEGRLHVSPKHRITADHRALITGNRDELVRTLQSEDARPSGNPLLCRADWDEAHLGGWDDAEMAAYLGWQDHYRAAGCDDAEHLAEVEILIQRRAQKGTI